MDLSTIQPLLDWIAAHPALAGVVICLVAALESLALVGIVVPGIVFMLGIGTLVGLDALPLETTLLWAAIGAVIGDGVSFWLGRHFDRQLRHIWPLSRYPRLIPKGERFFRRHGAASILFGRFVGPVRPIIPAVAGIMHMDATKFYIVNIVSAILWAPTVILPGVLFGESLQLASEVVYRLALFAGAIVIVAALLVWLVNRIAGSFIEESFDTLTSLVFQHMGRTGMASVTIFLTGVISVSTYITTLDTELKAVNTIKQIDRKNWWETGWEQFNPQSDIGSGFSFAIQWWGALPEIESRLLKLQWQKGRRLSFKNALIFFTPPDSGELLPIPVVKYRNRKAALEMLQQDQQSSRYLLLRLWQVFNLESKNSEQLWVGTIEVVDEMSVFGLARFPDTTGDCEKGASAFENQLLRVNSFPKWRTQVYTDAMKNERWHGKVMLIGPGD